MKFGHLDMVALKVEDLRLGEMCADDEQEREGEEDNLAPVPTLGMHDLRILSQPVLMRNPKLPSIEGMSLSRRRGADTPRPLGEASCGQLRKCIHISDHRLGSLPRLLKLMQLVILASFCNSITSTLRSPSSHPETKGGRLSHTF